MSGPLIWIFLPAITALILLYFQKYRTGVLIVGIFVSVNLALAAWFIPFNENLGSPSTSFLLTPKIRLFDYLLFFQDSDRIPLILLYGFTGFMMAGTLVSRPTGRFVPVSLLASAFIAAAISFHPDIYGVIFFLPVILLFVFVLSLPGYEVNNGVLKLLVFQIVGLTSLLLASGMILVDPNLIENTTSTGTIALLLVIGFFFLTSIFPVSTWLIKSSNSLNTYVLSYVGLMIFGFYIHYFNGLIGHYNWLVEVFDVPGIVIKFGTIMVIAGGFWAVTEKHLGRLFGYVLVVGMGNILLSMGIQTQQLNNYLFIPISISISVGALAITVIKSKAKDFDMMSINGFGTIMPITCIAAVTANLSVAGLPLFACFPGYLTLWNNLVTISTGFAILAFAGNVGLMVGVFRSLKQLFNKDIMNEPTQEQEIIPKIFLIIGVVILFMLGVFPHWFYQLIINILSSGFVS